MRQVLVTLATATLLAGAALTGGGCGSKSYEERLSKTLENMRYQARLKANLMDPLQEGEWEVRGAGDLRPAPEESDLVEGILAHRRGTGSVRSCGELS